MSAPVIHVVARVTARPDTVSEVSQLLRGLVAPTRREDGCLRYELLQSAADPAEFCFVEEWRDEAAERAHLASPHLAAVLARAPALLGAPPDIRRFRRLL